MHSWVSSLHPTGHVVHLLAVQQLHNKREELVLSELGLLKDVLHGTKVGLNLLLDVLVHAQLHLGLLAALWEHLDLAKLDGAEGLAGDDGVLGNLSGQVGGHLVASVKEVLVLVLEPLAGHGVLLDGPLHGLHINVVAGVQDVQKYTMPSEWFKNKYEHLLDTCYETATNLPAEIAENSVITGETFGTVKLGEVKMFSKCCEKAKMKLCMHQDIKNKVESNFGPMEDILQETQLTEHEFFPLVMQLLHGKEMDYMTGGM